MYFGMERLASLMLSTPQSNPNPCKVQPLAYGENIMKLESIKTKCDGRCESRHECQGEAKPVHILLGSKDWGRFHYCNKAREEDKRNGYTVLFENVSCSQCGRDFGEGERGFSHCEDHMPMPSVSEEDYMKDFCASFRITRSMAMDAGMPEIEGMQL